MRFKATNENLTIQASPDEVAECVRRIVRLVVPHYARKVYLFDILDTDSLRISEPGLVIVDTVDMPSNLEQSFRIILLRGDLIVVSGQRHLTRSQWRDLATELEAHAD